MPQAQTYQSEFTGLEMDARFAAVAQLTAALEALTTVVAQKYVKPASGIPSTDMDADVQAALAKANTAVQSLADYYTKSEVDQLLAAINGMEYVDAAALPTASASTMGKIYLVGPDASGYYAYYYTSYDGSAYSWVGPLGTTQISLANYATKAELSQLDQDVADLQAQVDGITPIIINGDVTNAPDEEDITMDENDLLKFKDRTAAIGQLGYKILRKGASFASQVTDINTIYEIRYDFDLASAFTMPAGCVLRFVGGSISGSGTLTFSNTKIEGEAIIQCNCGGTINGVIDLCWFGLKANDATFDNGPLINKYAALSNSVKIDNAAHYYFSTPIALTNKGYIYLNCFFHYNGLNGNLSAIKVSNSVGGVIAPEIYIRSVQCERATVTPDYSHNEAYFLTESANTEILRGIEFDGINNGKVKVDVVREFNENVRISDTAARGNSYNEYTIGYSFNANVHIRVYQDNGGWCYANKLYGHRLTNSYSSFSDQGGNHYYSCAGMFAGPGVSSDTNNDNSNWLIEKTSTEGFDSYAFILKNCGNFSFIGGRVETQGQSVNLVKVVGYCTNISVRNYLLSGAAIDYSAADALSFKSNTDEKYLLAHLDASLVKAHCHKTAHSTYNFAIDNGIQLGAAYYQYRDAVKYVALTEDSDGTPLIGPNGNVSFGAVGHYFAYVIDTAAVKSFLLRAKNAPSYIQIVYLEDNNGASIASSKAAQEGFGIPINGTINNPFEWSDSTLSFSGSLSSTQDYNFFFTVPTGVSKILLRCRITNFELFSIGGTTRTIIPAIREAGTTAQRPATSVSVDYTNMVRTVDAIAYPGFKYFDTTLDGMVVRTSTDWKEVADTDFAVQALTSGGKKIWAGTQAEYDLLTPASDTIYFIKSE